NEDTRPSGGPVAPRGHYARLFRNQGFLRVFTAGIGSTAGSAVAGICLIWIVWTATGSALDIGLLGTAFLASAIAFSVFGGTLVDRYDRRRLMILSDVSRAAAVAVVVVVLYRFGFDLPVLLGANLVMGAFSTLFNPAEQSVIPSLLPGELVGDANGLVRSSRSTVQFVGASLGGILIVTLGPLTGVGINVVTFLLSAALLAGMDVESPRRAAAQLGGGVRAYFADLSAGFRWLYQAKGFFQLTLSATFFNFCSNVIGTFLVIFATVVLHGSALVFAALLAVEVAGSAIGSVMVSRVGAERWAGKAWTLPYGAVAGGFAILLALVPSVPVALVVLFALGALGGFAGTAWLTAAQLLVPTDMQGRYFGIDSFGSVAILPAAQIGGALLIGLWGTQMTYLVVAGVWLATGLAFLLPRALWRLGYPPAVEDAASYRSDVSAAGTPRSPAGTPSD
ncbi:MAG: MFS transporter, partial [Thermoplasmata archaeon]|nr:MFS transporter [Thermoplasmata archaeon]